MEETLVMKKRERTRLIIMERVKNDGLKLTEASELLSLCYRQTHRVWVRYLEEAEYGLIHRSRGRHSNNAYGEQFREKVLNLYRERYLTFGPLFASEKMEEEFGIKINDETLRLWLIEERLWSKRRHRKKHRRYREPRYHFGELVQMDGSDHRWFQKRRRDYCLLSMVDDATGITLAKFDYEETTELAMQVLWKWVEKYGIPKAIYVDRNNVYILDKDIVEEKKLNGEEALTHFGMACKKLGIKIISSYSPQARGRVERKNGVHQDRLVKELKLKNINEREKANKFLDNYYLDKINRKFGKKAKSKIDFHMPVPRGLDLRTVFCFEEERSLNPDWTVRYDNCFYQIIKDNKILPIPKDKVTITKWLDGSIHIIYKDNELKYKILDSKPEKINEKIILKPRKKYIPPPSHPWRKFSFRRLHAQAMSVL